MVVLWLAVLSSDPRDIDMESALVMKLRGLREGMVRLYSSCTFLPPLFIFTTK